MKIKSSFAIALFAVSLLAACNNTPALPTVAPTIAAPTQPVVSATANVTATTPPTPVPAVRRTLPPEWTATTPPTATVVVPTEVVIPPTPFVPQADLPPACDTFDVLYDQSAREFQLGTSPTVAWVPVEGSIRYNVQLSDANGRTVKSDIFIAETSYTFDANLFKQTSNVYAWSVYPINQAGDQMCFSVGDTMYPSLTPVQ